MAIADKASLIVVNTQGLNRFSIMPIASDLALIL